MMLRNLLLLFIVFLTSCSTGSGFSTHASSLEVHSMGLDRVVLRANCTTIVCTEGFANEGDIWMTDIPLDQLTSGEYSNGQIIHLQLLWTPVAGKTPLASTSTNLAIKYFIIAEGKVGIYSGGGFAWLSGTPEKGMLLNIEGATVAIETPPGAGFADRLTPATVVGKVRSVPNQTIARQIATAAELIRQ